MTGVTVILTDQLRHTLKRMWFLNGIVNRGDQLGREDTKFYNENLKYIRHYYMYNAQYWNDQEKLNSIL